MSRRHVGTMARASRRGPDARAAGPAETVISVGADIGSVAMPTRSSTSRCSSVGMVGPEQPVDAGRSERDPGRLRLGRVRVDAAGRDGPAGPLGDQSRRAIRAEPGEPELLALLEAQAGLGAEGVALAGPPDRDRVEDRRLDDHVGRGVR